MADVTGHQVADEARRHMGAKWRHQGRTPGPDGALDCIGLIVVTAHALGLSRFDVSNYGPVATDETLRDGCREHLVEVPLADMRPGDVVVMRFAQGARHIGFIGDYRPAPGMLSVIHSCALNPRRVVEQRLDAAWRGRIMNAFRFPQCN